MVAMCASPAAANEAPLEAKPLPTRLESVERTTAPACSCPEHRALLAPPTETVAHRLGGDESDASLCVICIDAARTHALLPCGHKCLCSECAVGQRRCPLCRSEVEGVVRVWE